MPSNMILEEMQALSQAAESGFALAFHIQYTRPTFLFQTYPDAWISEYSEKGMVMSDPTVHWGFENDGTRRWSDLAEQDSAGVLKSAASHGLRYGVTCAFGSGESRSMCSFSRADREFEDTECAALFDSVKKLHAATEGMATLNDAQLADLEKIGVTVSQPGGR